MRARLQRLLTGRFGRNVIWMTGATVLAHGLFLLASPVLTRLYSPDAFADLGILMTVQALLLSGMTARIEWSVPTAGNPRRASALVAAALGVLTLTSVVLMAGIWLGFERVGARFDVDPALRLLFMALPLSVLAAGAQTILHSWCVGSGQLRPVAFTKFLQSAVFVGVALVAGLASGAGLWLAAGFAISHVIAGVVLLMLLTDLMVRLLRLRRGYVRAVLKRQGSEILASLGSSLLHNLAFYLPFLMIWIWYDDTALGWFAFVLRIGTAPLSFLSQALAKSFWAEAADLAKRDPVRLRRFFMRTVGMLGLIAVPFAAVCLTAPVYFGLVFGQEWTGAGSVMAALTPMLVALLVFSSTNHLIVYRRQHWQMWCDALSVVLFGGLFWMLAAAGYGVVATLALSSLAFLASYGIRFWLHLVANRLWTGERNQ